MRRVRFGMLVLLALFAFALCGCMVTTYYEVLVADFTFSTESHLTLELVRFDASVSRIEQRESSFMIGPQGVVAGPNNGIVRYYWDFGDGTILDSGSPLISHAYLDDGTYWVTLTVVDYQNRSASLVKEITILNRRPVAGFIWRHCSVVVMDIKQISPMGIVPIPEPRHVCLELVANSHEQGRHSLDADGHIVSYQWSHGHLSLGYGPVLRCNFLAGQTYPITLTVIDDDGATASITLPVAVH